MDAIDTLLVVLKMIAYVFMCKTKHDLTKFEDRIAKWFGMTRMNWLSFGKQRTIGQLFFESVPQVCKNSILTFVKIRRC